MKKIMTLFLSLIGFSYLSLSQHSPFDTLQYNQVVAYEYSGGDGKGQLLIVENNKLASSVTKEKILSKVEETQILDLINDTTSFGGDKAFCFIPRIGIVFYNNNKVVAHISICLQCNYLASSIEIAGITKEYIDNYQEGFSISGKRKITTLCNSFNFEHCKEK